MTQPPSVGEMAAICRFIRRHEDLGEILDQLHQTMPEEKAVEWRYRVIIELLAEISLLRGSKPG